MRTQQAPRYAYNRDRDGCDDTFDIWDIQRGKVIDSVPFWDSVEGEEAEAEEDARRIVRELNLHDPRNVRAFDDVA
jgi:hypothetical protein